MHYARRGRVVERGSHHRRCVVGSPMKDRAFAPTSSRTTRRLPGVDVSRTEESLVSRVIRLRRSGCRDRRTMRSDELDGWEFNIQQMFGDSGFGVQANYTMVDSGFKYDNTTLRLLSIRWWSGGFVQLGGVLRQVRWQVRAAYNWRDEFLTAYRRWPGSERCLHRCLTASWISI
jgi:hypothetical protein